MSDPDTILKAKLKVINETHRCVPGKTALLVIDMQRGFIDEGASLEVAAARDIIPSIARGIPRRKISKKLREAKFRLNRAYRNPLLGRCRERL